MNQPTKQQKIRELHQMLFEMGTGNFTFRIPQSDIQDEVDGLAFRLNSVAAEMQSKILEAGFVNPKYHYKSFIQYTFILDSHFIILGFSSGLPATLEYRSEQLFQMNFDELLATQILPLWVSLKSKVMDDARFHDTIELLFITAGKQIIPLFCTISRLLYANTIIISSVTSVFQDTFADSKTISSTTARPSEASIIQNVYDYILANLEEPLPSTKELSKMFGTNEFTLKDGFRHFFNTSIYQFYTEKRLQRAHMLLQQTEIPIKAIAFMSGFNDYTNFYKSFKKRFQYAPSEVLRNRGPERD